MPTDTVLSDEVLREVEARRVVDHHLESGVYIGCYILLSTSERDALCATVRALRQQLTACEGSRRVHELDNHHNALACGYCAGPLKDELQRLQSQIRNRK